LYDTYSYDSYGRLGNDVVTTFTYDNLGRRTVINDPSAGTRSFVYNNDGTLYSETDADGRTTTMTYDAYLRLATKAD
jgi:YD repeat-containing protein